MSLDTSRPYDPVGKAKNIPVYQPAADSCEIKRRTNVVQVLPNDDALLPLVTVVLIELHDELGLPSENPRKQRRAPNITDTTGE